MDCLEEHRFRDINNSLWRSMLPFDLVGILQAGLVADDRPNDGLLHPSGDLIGPLRHSQLRVAGAPRNEEPLVSRIRLMTGTLWHKYYQELLVKKGLTITEVNCEPWLPDGWAGTADWVFYSPTDRAFILGDLKTIKGEGLPYVREGPKEEHLWQLSAYYWALAAGKFPLRKRVFVMYLPLNDDMRAGEPPTPTIVETMPLPRDQVWGEMEARWELTKEYLSSLPDSGKFVTAALAEPMARVQKLYRNGDKYELKLVPHWSCQFCPYDDSLCDCNKQGTTKIGEYVEGIYVPRKGYEHIEPLLSAPSSPAERT